MSDLPCPLTFITFDEALELISKELGYRSDLSKQVLISAMSSEKIRYVPPGGAVQIEENKFVRIAALAPLEDSEEIFLADVREFIAKEYSESEPKIGFELVPGPMKINGAPADVNKPLATTERNTLLTIIAALCDYSAIKYQDRGAAGQIAKMTDEIGAPVTDDTIRKVLAKIQNALGNRVK